MRKAFHSAHAVAEVGVTTTPNVKNRTLMNWITRLRLLSQAHINAKKLKTDTGHRRRAKTLVKQMRVSHCRASLSVFRGLIVRRIEL